MEEELEELLEKFDKSFGNLFANWIDNRVGAYEKQYLEFRNSTVDMIRLCE